MKFKTKLILNKANGQVNISLPKKKIPKKTLETLDKYHQLEITFDKI
jgi:hypothetical protein